MTSPSPPRPTASLSLDLDNQWSYMKTRGDEGWRELPSYLGTLVPRMLDLLAGLELQLTVFIVGQDAALPGHHEVLASIPRAGHEVGNHSFHHEPWLHLYSLDELIDEVETAEQAIEAATGLRPEGFRGPGYSLSKALLELLHDRGYSYDASTLPTFIGPLGRAYYFLRAGLDRQERRQRQRLFGSVADGLRPVKPYRWRLDHGELLEIPVTTLPVARTPFHLSYVLYLSTYSWALARAYFRTALATCSGLGVEPSILMHPLDLLGKDDVDALAFFPGMALDGATKRERVRTLLRDASRRFDVVPMGEHARRLARRELPTREPRFSAAPTESRRPPAPTR